MVPRVERFRTRIEMPLTVKYGVGAAVALVVAGAIYLLAVRGPVMLLDLASGVAGLLCM